MKKQPVKKEPPPGSPLARAKQLNRIAGQTIPDTAGLSERERVYVEKLHRYLVRYWHRQISKDELQACQNMLAAHLLCDSPKEYYIKLWSLE